MFLAPQQSVCSGVEFSRYLLAAGAIEVARFHIHCLFIAISIFAQVLVAITNWQK